MSRFQAIVLKGMNHVSYDCFFGNVVGHCSDNFPPPPQTNTLSNNLLAVSYLSIFSHEDTGT